MKFEGLWVRREAIESGWSSSSIGHMLRTGQWSRRYDGIYVERDSSEGATEENWRRELAAHLARAGEGAAVSHRSAARLHGLDGSWGDHTDVVLPHDGATLRERPGIRSRTLESTDVTTVDGLPVCSVGRTLADLGRFVSLDALEMAVESVLRVDPRTPYLWRTEPLEELYERVRPRRGSRPGHAALRRTLLRRPPGSRPTGSAAETRAVQALRSVALGDLTRQPTVRVFDGHGDVVRTFYPDLADLSRGFLLEIDGLDAHSSADALDSDLIRQNALLTFFHVERASGRRVSREPKAFAAATRAAYERTVVLGSDWTRAGMRIQLTPEGCDVSPR